MDGTCPDVVRARLLNTIRQGDYYLITDDFDSCGCRPTLAFSSRTDVSPTDIEALRMVDEAYTDRTEWIKKSIRTTAKVCDNPIDCVFSDV